MNTGIYIYEEQINIVLTKQYKKREKIHNLNKKANGYWIQQNLNDKCFKIQLFTELNTLLLACPSFPSHPPSPCHHVCTLHYLSLSFSSFWGHWQNQWPRSSLSSFNLFLKGMRAELLTTTTRALKQLHIGLSHR